MDVNEIVDKLLLDSGVHPTALLLAYFDNISKSKTASAFDKKDARLAKQLLAGMPINFLKDIASQTGLALWDLIKVFKNTIVIKFFSKIKWSFKRLYELLKTGYEAYKNLQKAVAEYVSKTKVVKWTEKELDKLDQWLQNHPKISRLAGVAIAGLLVYIWFNMAFTGDFQFDFDMKDVVAALGGSFSLASLFAGPEGTRLLIALAVGAGLKLTFPWPGPNTIKFVVAMIVAIAKSRGIRLKKNANMTKFENRIVDRIFMDMYGIKPIMI